MLAMKAAIKPWHDQTLEDDRSNQLSNMTSNKLVRAPAFEGNGALVGVEIAVVRVDNEDTLWRLVEDGVGEAVSVASLQINPVNRRYSFLNKLEAKIALSF